MSSEPRSVVLETGGRGGGVVAIVEADRRSDALICRAIDEATRRSGDLVVIQLVDEPSAVRRALAKAVLRKDLGWWSRDRAGTPASITALDDGSLGEAAAWVREASCVVMLARTMQTAPGAELLLGAGCSQSHAWPHASAVATDHSP